MAGTNTNVPKGSRRLKMVNRDADSVVFFGGSFNKNTMMTAVRPPRGILM
jgi:hypothetical protein